MSNDQTVLEATFETGFGKTPDTYRRGGDGLEIRYTIVRSSFGHLLATATEYGICAVTLGRDEAALVDELEEDFPHAASFERDDESLRPWVRPIVQYLDGALAHPTVPLDLQGTDFQRHVWRVLQQIPYGETRFYSEVAAMMGRPKAARAVARACASNKVAVVIPCHRVVRKDGAHGGYRWGPEIKERLLQHEQRQPREESR